MSKSAMPKSKAKTAYGLLSEIRKLILEEPKRYDQTGWLIRGKRYAASIYGDMAPACGTVGCVGGWVQALKGRSAGRTLGLNYQQQVELFDGAAAGKRWEFSDGGSSRVTVATVRAHARRGAKHIARFQKKYSAQLKAKRV